MSLSSNFPTSKPSLNLDFANVGALDPRITFTRSSSATYTNSLGLITTAATNVARFDYGPVTLAARGLLIEEQRTNLLVRSEQLDSVPWTQNQVSVTQNSVTAPDGQTAGETITSNTANNYHAVWQNITVSAGATYSWSVFLKKGSWQYAQLNFGGGGTTDRWIQCIINLDTGTILSSSAGAGGTLVSANISSFGNGWYRVTLTGSVSTDTSVYCYISVLSGATPTLGNYGLEFAAGSTSNNIYAWGAQVEAGSFATSYIPTVASTVIRSADVASVNTLSPWFNATEGTVFAEFDFIGLNPASPGINQGVACFTDGTATSNNLGLLGYGDGSASRSGFVFSGSSLVAFLGGSASSVNTTYKSALATKANDFRLVNSGGSVISDTSGAMPTGMNQLILGNLYTTTNLTYQNGHLRRVAYYPRALTTAELQALTS